MRSAYGEAITVGALRVRFLVEADTSNGSVTLFECDVPAQARMPAPHSHDAFEETIYELEGITTWTVDGEAIEIGPGEAICIPQRARFRQSRHRRRDIPCGCHSWRLWLRLLPRGRRRPGRGRPAGPRCTRSGDASPRPHARRYTLSLTPTDTGRTEDVLGAVRWTRGAACRRA